MFLWTYGDTEERGASAITGDINAIIFGEIGHVFVVGVYGHVSVVSGAINVCFSWLVHVAALIVQMLNRRKFDTFFIVADKFEVSIVSVRMKLNDLK
jgi:hypothetical protein